MVEVISSGLCMGDVRMARHGRDWVVILISTNC
jgi:hypothetical protein